MFLSRVSTMTRDIDIAILSVCPSVRLSVRNALVSHENRLIQFFYHTVAQPLSFTGINHLHKIPTGSPTARALNTGAGGIKISRFFTNKSLYLADDTR